MTLAPATRASAASTDASAAPSDLELAALISSKICHDVIGPVGAINNGLEILDEDGSAESQSYALEVIRNVTQQASARLQFARFAFGASGSAGSSIELDMARDLARAFVGDGKHKLVWDAPSGHMPKDAGKLVLNLVASAVSALPRGGDIALRMGSDLANPTIEITCTGKGARRPNFLGDLVNGTALEDVDAMSIQAYYTWRLAGAAGIELTIDQCAEGVVVITGVPNAERAAA
ncbi:MAG: histidine phosphotransferase family protein [Pseudomonadota bacterium]